MEELRYAFVSSLESGVTVVLNHFHSTRLKHADYVATYNVIEVLIHPEVEASQRKAVVVTELVSTDFHSLSECHVCEVSSTYNLRATRQVVLAVVTQKAGETFGKLLNGSIRGEVNRGSGRKAGNPVLTP